jgi:ketosteroid isomerase-like protein
MMSVNAEMVQRWLDAYSHAWITYDPGEIGALFADDVAYRWHPWDEGDDVVRGRDQIVNAWLNDHDTAGTYYGEYRPLVIQGDQAIATGMSYYYTDTTQMTLERAYHNLWVLQFTDDGKCRSFTEWYMKAPDAS